MRAVDHEMTDAERAESIRQERREYWISRISELRAMEDIRRGRATECLRQADEMAAVRHQLEGLVATIRQIGEM